MAPQSSNGVNEQTFSIENEALRFAVSIITSFKFQRIEVAWLWPKGKRRWQADTRLAMD